MIYDLLRNWIAVVVLVLWIYVACRCCGSCGWWLGCVLEIDIPWSLNNTTIRLLLHHAPCWQMKEHYDHDGSGYSQSHAHPHFFISMIARSNMHGSIILICTTIWMWPLQYVCTFVRLHVLVEYSPFLIPRSSASQHYCHPPWASSIHPTTPSSSLHHPIPYPPSSSSTTPECNSPYIYLY